MATGNNGGMFVRLQSSHAPLVHGEQIGLGIIVWTWLNRPLGTVIGCTGAANRDVTWPLEQPWHSLHQMATSEEHLFQTKRDKIRLIVALMSGWAKRWMASKPCLIGLMEPLEFHTASGCPPSLMHEGAMKKKSAGQQCQGRCAEGSGSVIQGTDPRIRICTKMSRIWNTVSHAIGGGPFWYYVMFAFGWDLAELWMRSRRVWMRPSRG